MNNVTTHFSKALALAALSLSILASGCGGHSRKLDASAIRVGMSKPQVKRVAGTPSRTTQHCWIYRLPHPTADLDARRVCFADGRVAVIQRGVASPPP
jgi:hypothetical protein